MRLARSRSESAVTNGSCTRMLKAFSPGDSKRSARSLSNAPICLAESDAAATSTARAPR